MLRATYKEAIPLKAFVSDGRNDLFVRIRLYDYAGLQINEYLAYHQTEGIYCASWTPQKEGYYTALYDFYLDAEYTTPSIYERVTEDIEVTSDKTNLARILGLHHENSVLDQQTYSNRGRLLTARLRSFNTRENADAALAVQPEAYTTGLLFTWAIRATYDTSDQPATFTIGREP